MFVENKLANSKQDLTITRIEMSTLQQENVEKVTKAQGEQFQSLTQIASGQADIAKLENQYENTYLFYYNYNHIINFS